MKTTFMALVFLIAACGAAGAQVVPEATGPSGLPVSGSMHYTVRYGQSAEFGNSLGNWQTANLSGDLDYANGKTRRPFSMTYGGGYTWTFTGPTYTTGLFQHLLLSQGFVYRKWSISATDNVSYLPGAPTTGFSGVAGIGEPVGGTGSTTPPTQPILTVNAHVVNNTASGDLQRTLSSATSLSAGINSNLLRYPDGNGLDTDSLSANAGLKRRLNARNSVLAQYTYSQYSYPGFTNALVTNSVVGTYTRQWNRRLTTTAGAGPEWVGSSTISNTSASTTGDSATTTTVPSSTRVSVNGALTYNMRFGSAGVNYSRGTNGGSGYLIGAETDSVAANFSREFDRNLTIGITGSYMRTAGLANNGVTGGKFGGVQASRRIGKYLNAYASYTAIDQATSSTLNNNALSGLMQVVGFGIGYSPKEKHLTH